MKKGIGPEFELPFPDLDLAAYHGPLGEFALSVATLTEAASAAILVQSVVIAGCYIGRGPHFEVNSTKHFCNENIAIIGATGTARKGTGSGIAKAPMMEVDPAWMSRQGGGMATGEGLINAIRDPSEPRKKLVKFKGELVERITVDDPGVEDKRALFVQSEFSTVLALMARDHSILSDTIKDAWDSLDQLRSRPKVNPLVASNPHVSIIAHSTAEALQEHLSLLSIHDGFANRFLFFFVTRAGLIPLPGRLPQRLIDRAAQRLREAIRFAKSIGAHEYRFSPVAAEAWKELYKVLSGPRPAILGRCEGHVMRFAMIYAVLDCSRVIELVHLRAALAVWEYAERSANHIVPSGTGNADADRIVEKLREVAAEHEGAKEREVAGTLTRSEIADAVFNKRIKKNRLSSALALLEGKGLVESTKEPTGGAPRMIYRAVDADAQAAASRYLPLIADLKQGPMKLEVPTLPPLHHRNGKGPDEVAEFFEGSTQTEIIAARNKEGGVQQ